jgi:anti-sigma regulatory factor (Ser/Thr protein kinase)
LTTATPERFVHPALFYRNTDEYLAGTVGFVNAGLAAGEPVAVAVPGPNLGLIRDALGQQATDVHMLDMTDVGRNPGRIIPYVLLAFAQAHSTRSVRIIGEPIWAGRSSTEYPACVQHEALINMAFAGREATILCPYDVAQLDEEVVNDAWRTHPLVIDGDGERASTSYAPDKVVDGYNMPLPAPENRASRGQFLFNATNLNQTRAYAVAHATRLGLSAPRTADVKSAVAELANNSVVHGGGRGVLEFWAADGYVVCQVRDAGTIADPLAGRRPVSPHSGGGRGLLLVNQLADLVRTHASADSTTVRLYFRR